MSLDKSRIFKIVKAARNEGRTALLEIEGLEILKAMSIPVPAYCFVNHEPDVTKPLSFEGTLLPGERVVIKVVSPDILHKSDVGGVRIVKNDRDIIGKTVFEMEVKFRNQSLKGFLIAEFVDFDSSPGSELLVGMRMTPDFGPVLTFGPGGIYTEFLASNFREGKNVAILSPTFSSDEIIDAAIKEVAITPLICEDFRGKPPLTDISTLSEIVSRFLDFAREFMPSQISEFEVNPFVLTGSGPVALDVLVKLSEEKAEKKGERPVEKIRNLLEPRSAAIVGVSKKMNMGHIILNNFLREGFQKDRLYVIKPGLESIEGCVCYPDVGSLPERVDLLVLCVPASLIPSVVTETIEKKKAESIIVIPGGLEEKEGTENIVRKMHEDLQKSRSSDWKGPVINGGNCLGIISRPGRYDNMFIPDYKKTEIIGEISPVAFISQSGAFAVSRLNKLRGINPRYTITIGNQMDLTVGDYLTFLKDDPEIEIFAIYMEGFRPLDGNRFLMAAKEIVESGRSVIFYKAGRTEEGARAMESHTASIAGDYMVTRELSRRAGVIFAESLKDFEDLTRLFVFLRDKQVSGMHIGVISNAGCECVAASDNLRNFRLAKFSSDTNQIFHRIFEETRIEAIVDIHNPIDLTPMAGDRAYEETIRAMMSDPGVDVGIIACIPLAPALNALPPAAVHRENFLLEDSVVQRMIKLKGEIKKAWVAVVDAGYLFDPMVRLFEERGIPTFRTIDRALRFFDIFCRAKL